MRADGTCVQDHSSCEEERAPRWMNVSKSVDANLLDDSIADALVSVGGTRTFTLPFLSTPPTAPDSMGRHIASLVFEGASRRRREIQKEVIAALMRYAT